MSRSLDKSSFFVVNMSDRNVCLSDLAITIPAGRCYDLLNDNFNFTIEQLITSMKSGSIYKKRDKIRVTENRPRSPEPIKIKLSQYPIITKQRTAVTVKDVNFDELIVSDEEYANEIAKEFD